ncbi:MAG: hypothetical protein CFE44_09150 [Burkholderiales bacterium PBB4]|nr:MAG: hypothetical protein CFE44_09150 [Burkholderiales bacterium PBB4]
MQVPTDRWTLFRGALCGLAAALIREGRPVAVRPAVTASLAPQDVTLLRFGVSALHLWPVLLGHGLNHRQIGFRRLLVIDPTKLHFEQSQPGQSEPGGLNSVQDQDPPRHDGHAVEHHAAYD